MIPAAAAGSGSYPERDDAPEPFFDRLFAGIGFHWHNARRRKLALPAPIAAEASRRGGRPAVAESVARLPNLRYALRRDGLLPEPVAECFGHYCAALAASAEPPRPDAFGAGWALLQGRVAELPDAVDRSHALGLAATTWAICGIPVHLVTASDARSRAAAAALQVPLAGLGLGVAVVAQDTTAAARRVAYAGPVVCAAQREIAHDYLRDLLMLGGRAQPLSGALRHLAGGPSGAKVPTLRGLQCALVEDADGILLDEAHLPLVIATDAEQPRERLVYEQALELARALSASTDFTLDDEGARLTENGTQRVERLVGPLGGIWAAKQRREDLIALALDALHLRQRDVDYRVEQERIAMAPPEGPAPAEPTEADVTLKRLIEVKEGCRLGLQPDVRARVSVPRFLRRYVRLAGICGDARGAEREFWALYGLKMAQAGVAGIAESCAVRVFATAAAKRESLVARVRALAGAGNSVVVAASSPAEGKALHGTLKDAGLEPGVLQGASGAAEQQALAVLERPGSVMLALHPTSRRAERSASTKTPLKLVVAELHDSRRHVGRICHALAADSCEIMVSLEDEAMATRIGPAAAWWAHRGSGEGGELSPERASWILRHAQREIERAGAAMRQEIVLRDRQLDDLLAFSGKRE